MTQMDSDVLLLDAGNTRLKWALARDGRITQQGVAEYASLAPLAAAVAQAQIGRAIGCNVAGPDTGSALERCLAPLPLTWLKASAAMAGVKNAYRQPTQLGADRWAALIGARAAMHSADVIVVMAGTAMTVDALTQEGEFLGGIIAPGFRLMRQSLALGTADLGLPEGEVVAFPQSTGEAIVNGALAALIGAIDTMRLRLEAHTGRAPYIMISGGDGPLLAPLLQARLAERVIPVDNLVLSGLLRLSTLPHTTGLDVSV